MNRRFFSPTFRAHFFLSLGAAALIAVGLSHPLQAIVINELHIDEEDKTKKAEFIELYNNSGALVDVSGWYFSSGVDYVFPASTTIPAGGYVVIAQDPSAVLSEFGVGGALGPWIGKLSNEGERVTLRDAAGTKIDEVDYQLGFPWGTFGEAPSPSLELINPNLDNDLGGSWRSSGNVPAGPAVPAATYVPRNELQWSYRKGLTFPTNDGSGKNWTQNGYDESLDGQWLLGQAPIGFNDDDDNTELNDMQGNYITFFMRREFSIAPGQVPSTLTLRALYDDGLAIWINGVEITRYSLDGGAIAFPPPDRFANSHEAAGNYQEVSVSGAASYLVEGVNTLCVQQINTTIGSSDATADVELVHVPSGGGASFSPADPTPGAANTVFASNAPPAMRQVAHLPESPASTDDVTVSVKVTDGDGVASVSLDYQLVDPGDYIKIDDARYETQWTNVPMVDDGTGGDLLANDDVYTVVLPASLQTHRRLVRYRIHGTDNVGASVTGPYADDPQPNFAYFVYDAIPTWTGRATPSNPNVTYDFNALPALQQNVDVYQLITTRAEHVDAQYIPGTTRGSGYGGSDYLWKGTLVYDGKVYDHIRFRARGGVWRYAMGKNMWKFDFNRGHRFQARDNFGKKYDTVWDKVNFSAIIQQGNFNHRGEQGLFESVGFELFNLAGSEACHTHYVHFRLIEDASENGPTNSQFDDDFQGLYLAIEQMDGQYLEEHDMPDGNLYKMEGGTGTLNNQGPDQPTNRSDLNAFLNAYNGGTQTEQWWRDNLDLPRYYAYRTIVEGIHHFDIAGGKNYYYFNNPDSGKWEVHSWDLDLTWADNMFGSGNEPFKSRVLAISNLNQEYRNHCREILDLLFNSEQTDMLINEKMQWVWTPGQPSYVDADRAMWDYNPILVSSYVNSSKAGHGRFYGASVLNPDSFEGIAQKMRNYVNSRRSWLNSNVLTDSGQIPNRPTLTYTGLAGFPSNGITVDSSAYSSPSGSSFAAMEYRIAEITDTGSVVFDPSLPRNYEIVEDWESGELASFTASQKIPSTVVRSDRTYRARVRHKDAAGRWSHWSDPVEFFATAPDVSEFQQNLMITEFMFNPPQPSGGELLVSTESDDYEWIELTNVGASALDLTDVRFTKGVDFDFPPSTVLNGGDSILVVKNVAAFEARYGTGLPVIGTYGTDNLSNGGEQLKLSLAAGTAIHDFFYGDSAPWPTSADGAGYSLVLIDPESAPDHALAANWRISAVLNGTPASSDLVDYADWKVANGITDDGGDEDDDGFENMLEFFLTGDPNVGLTDIAPAVEVLPIDVGGVVDDYVTMTFQRRLGLTGFDYFVEFSDELEFWSANPAALVSSSPNGDGTVTEVWRSDLPVSSKEVYFVRLRVEM